MCDALTTVDIEENSQPETIGEGAFSDCTSLKKLTIPATVTSIGTAFQNCSALEEITFKSGCSITDIPYFTFQMCSSLISITIPSTVTSIGTYAFVSCSALEKVVFSSDSALESIGANAFDNCSSLQSIVIPTTVTSIGTSTNYILAEIYSCGNEPEATNIAGFNEFLLSNTTVYYSSDTQPDTASNFWHYVNGVVTKW